MELLSQTIKERIPLTGISQAEIAKIIKVSPAQLTQYLNGNSSLNKESLDTLLKTVGINHQIYSNRLKFAKEVAIKLKKFDSKAIINMGKDQMIKETGIEQIKYFPDFTESEMKEIVEKSFFDYEDTFGYLKTLVLYYNGVGTDTPSTTTSTKNFWTDIAEFTSGGFIGGGILGYIVPSMFGLGNIIGGAITLAMMGAYKSLQNNMISAFVDLAIAVSRKSDEKK
jgi:transcriptional regulator with XRE-family HTH domain